MVIDLNCDLGEGFGKYDIGLDEALMKHISSANIACGFHAGDPMTMEKSVRLAIQNNVKIGAHPGYPDLQGFGRRNMVLSKEEVKNIVIYQVGALDAFVRSMRGKLNHVKPHGALYNMAAKDPVLADAIAEAVTSLNKELILYGLAGSELERSAKKAGLAFCSEVFADRGYMEDGSLVPRSEPGAFIKDVDECASRIAQMVEHSKTVAASGKEIPIKAETICVHGDNEEALSFVKALKDKLELMGHTVG